MNLHRRNFLAGAALASAAVPALSVRAFAQAAPPAPATGRTQAPGFQRLTVGDTVVTAILDGSFELGADMLPNADQEQYDAALRAAFVPSGPYPAPVNAYVLERGGDVILIDAGAPSAMAPTVGKLPQNLAAAGIAPGSVTHILLTHMHGDHVGNLVDGTGAAMFPNAELIVRDRELTFWTDPSEETRIPESQRMMVPLARNAAKAYEGRTTSFADDVDVLPGISAVALYGHTPGHTGFRIADGDGLLVWADIIHVAPVQSRHPEVFIGFDISPEDAVAARKRILEQVAADRTMVTGMHMPFPGFSHVVADGEGYRFVPVPWQFQS